MLKGKVRRALDSTVLDDAVATQDTVTQLISAIRRVRRLVPQAAALDLVGHDYSDPGKPRIAWDDDAARQQLVSALVNDALAVLAAVDGMALDGAAREAVGLLALVAGQDVEPGDGDGTWRIARGTAKDRVISTVDPDSRHIHKSVRAYRNGYKAHVVVEPVTGLICGQRLTAGNAPDYRRWRPMVERSLAWLVRPGRRVAYRGLARNRIWLAHRAAAINLQRLVNLGLTNTNGWQLAAT